METKTTVSGHIVSHDESVSAGLRYLMYTLNEEEKKVFFTQAFEHGSATFEDHMATKYKLIHNGSEYKLVKV